MTLVCLVRRGAGAERIGGLAKERLGRPERPVHVCEVFLSLVFL